MMAGHPNEASPLGLRNIAFAIHVGANDGGYNRSGVAKDWINQLEALGTSDPNGYRTQGEIHADKGHWMDLQDRVAIPWLQNHFRNPLPDKVVWFQDDVVYQRFYWLALPQGVAQKGQQVTASIDGQTILIEKSTGISNLLVRLNDQMIDLDQPITVSHANGTVLFKGNDSRSERMISKTFAERRDRALTFSAEIPLDLPASR